MDAPPQSPKAKKLYGVVDVDVSIDVHVDMDEYVNAIKSHMDHMDHIG